MSESPKLSDAPPADAPTRDEELPEPSTFTLQVVSPSVGVATPLSFPGFPRTANVKELKARIRDVLPSKPVDENQRLIHRGRMLGNENETMESVFGRATLESSQTQTLHLVLRPLTSDPPLTQPMPTPVPPVSGLPNLPQPRPQSTPLNATGASTAHLQAHFHELQRHNSQLHHNMQEAQMVQQRLQEQVLDMEQRYRQALAAAAQTHPHVAALPRFSQPIPAPPSVQAFLDQHRDQIARGRQMSQEVTTPGHATGAPSQPGRTAPAPGSGHTATFVQQGTGPNGQTWRTTTTVNETRTTISTPLTVRHTVQPAAAGPASDGAPYNPVPEMIAHMQANARATSRPPPGGTLNGHLGVPSTSSNPPSRNPSPHAGSLFRSNNLPSSATNPFSTPIHSQVPNPFSESNHHPPVNPFQTERSAPQFTANASPTVYILSSPQGPHALLVTGQNAQSSLFQQRAQVPTQDQEPFPRPPVVLPEYRNRHAARGLRQPNVPEGGGAAPVVLGAHGNANVPAVALAARLPNIIWLIVRLVGFVYFFTNGNATWGRWLLMTSISFIVLLMNLGLFNGFANALWTPLRARVERIIPLAGPDAALIPAFNAAPIQNLAPGAAVPQAAGNEPIRTGPHGELDPQQVANRIIAQQRQQQQQQGQSWLRERMRRIEHSMLLFMASLVPGVGERHIAAREAEANERQRQIEAAAAALEAAANPESAEGDATRSETAGEGTPGEAGAQNGGDQERVPLLDGQVA